MRDTIFDRESIHPYKQYKQIYWITIEMTWKSTWDFLDITLMVFPKNNWEKKAQKVQNLNNNSERQSMTYYD